MTLTFRWASVLALAFLVFSFGCSESATAPPDAPATHTVRKDGVFHAVGLQNPVANCTACHGATLMGGASGEPSCFKCHGQKW